MNRFFDNLPILKEFNGKLKLSTFLLFYSLLLGGVTLLTFRPSGVSRIICVLAMQCSWCGDVLLNERSLQERTKTAFYSGAIFFMVAHIIYSYAYFTMIKDMGCNIINAGFFVAVVMIALVIISFIIVGIKMKIKKSCTLYVLAILYVLIIGLNCSVIFSFSYSVWSVKPIYSLAGVGALSFFISDLFIGIETFFDVKSKVIRELVWWFYPIGQFIIITMG